MTSLHLYGADYSYVAFESVSEYDADLDTIQVSQGGVVVVLPGHFHALHAPISPFVTLVLWDSLDILGPEEQERISFHFKNGELHPIRESEITPGFTPELLSSEMRSFQQFMRGIPERRTEQSFEKHVLTHLGKMGRRVSRKHS